MKIAFFLAGIVLVGLNCFDNDERYYTRLSGWAIKAGDSTGINGLLLQLGDINPDNPEVRRWREMTTGPGPDSQPGFFDIDSVCFATTSQQGNQIVVILIDAEDNPGWRSQFSYLNLSGPYDTVSYYIYP